MKLDPANQHPWKPDKRFAKNHLLIPLIVAGLILFSLENTGIELWLADQWFGWEGGSWTLRHNWFAYDVIHHFGKQMIITFGLVLLCAFIISLRVHRFRMWRRPLGYFLTCMVLLPYLIASLKKFNTVVCPWDLARYGGELMYRHTFEHDLTLHSPGRCFPSGHASGGFALIALYFACLPYTSRPWVLLLPGVIFGSVFALGQEARGAHFLSHDLWSLTICWFGAVLLFYVIRPHHDRGVCKS